VQSLGPGVKLWSEHPQKSLIKACQQYFEFLN
jgi:hypothetical protein